MEKYGIDWRETPEPSIDLYCYRYPESVREMGGRTLDKFVHFRRALHLLFIKPFGNDAPLVWNDWTEEHAWSWCNDDFAVLWGPAAGAKSNDFGCFAVADWWAAPKYTCTYVCSTTKSMLEVRIWEAVKRYWGLHAGQAPGKLSKARTAIISDDDDDKSDDVKAGIHGVAVMQGSVEEAKANIIGVHLPFVRLIVDEMQATRRAAVDARANLSKGCQEFKFFGLANPSSILDPAGEFSEPAEGWDSVGVDTHKWRTRWGVTYHYDGFKSPAVTEPDGERKYPFLINRKQIDHQIAQSGSEDHPDVWTYCRGWPPAQGKELTVMTEQFVIKHHMRDKAEWQYDYQIISGLDPAFSAGGDKPILQVARVGLLTNDHYGIELLEPVAITILASSDVPPIYQVVNGVMEAGAQYGFTCNDLCVDETGTQSTGAVLDKEWGGNCHKITFGGRATELPLTVSDRRIAKEVYRNRVTELWFSVVDFARYDQIRGLGLSACKQFCRRVVLPGTPKSVESKLDMKGRIGQSPDEADAVVCVIAYLREVMGIFAGAGEGDVAEGDTKAFRDAAVRMERESKAGYGESPMGDLRGMKRTDMAYAGDPVG